eukprot:GHVT01044049.1.p1 GENE.GHVT01044049.1~~GHVT01044049.1.p1  ORF type:complete len:493 (+),score=46.86 GHVT01044049.1:307-1785(+)
MNRGGRNYWGLGAAGDLGRSNCSNWRTPDASRFTNSAGVEQKDAYWTTRNGFDAILQNLEDNIAQDEKRHDLCHPIIKRDFKYIKGLLKLHEEKDDLRKIIEAKNPIERRRGKQRIAKDWAAPVQEQIWKMLKDTNMRDYTLITPCQYAHYMNSEENLPTLTETFLKDLTPIAQKMYNALPEVAVKAWKLYAEGKHKAKFKEALNGLEIRKIETEGRHKLIAFCSNDNMPLETYLIQSSKEFSAEVLMYIFHYVDKLETILNKPPEPAWEEQIKAKYNEYLPEEALKKWKVCRGNLFKKARKKPKAYRPLCALYLPLGENQWTGHIEAQIKEQWNSFKADAQAKGALLNRFKDCRRRLSMKPGMHQIDMTDECLELTPEGFPIVNEERPPLIQDHDTRRPLASLGNGTSTATGLVGIMSVSLTAVMGYVVWKASKMIRGSPRRRTSIDVRAVERASDSTEEANVIVDARFAQKKNTSGCTKELEAADKNNSN